MLGTDDWVALTNKLELHFLVKKIEDEMKRAMLLTHYDDDWYELFSSLCILAKLATK